MLIIVGLAFAGLATGIASKIVPLIAPDGTSALKVRAESAIAIAYYSSVNQIVFLAYYSSTLASDILICVTLAWFLFRRKTKRAKVDQGASRIFIFILQTNFLAGMCLTVLLVIFFVTLNGATGVSQVTLVLFIFLPKLYSNALLYSLNMRAWYITAMTQAINREPRVTRAHTNHSSADDIEFALVNVAYPGVANSPPRKSPRSDSFTDIETAAETETEPGASFKGDLD